MNNGKYLVTVVICIMVFSSQLFSDSDTITGRIVVKGNEPFTILVIASGKGDMKIVGTMKQKIWDNYQGKTITVKGTVVKKGKGFMMLPELLVTGIVKVEE